MARRAGSSQSQGERARAPAAASRFGLDWTIEPEDLSREMVLRGCQRIQFAGTLRPALKEFPVLARLGSGGMGVVYFGFHPRLESEIAIKILPPDVQERHPDLVKRFLREAKLAARLSSDFLVRVFDVDRDESSGLYFLVMEFVRGASAGKWLAATSPREGHGVPEDQALDVCIAATRGLAAAHEQGTVHRDVKPDNILIPEDDAGRLLFNLAKLADLGLAAADDSAQRPDTRLTAARVSLMGTPGYAAPEQLEDPKKARKPADVFSMGATLFALLSGRNPFAMDPETMTSREQMPIIVATIRGQPEALPPLRPDLSPATLALVEICLRRDASERYPDAAALLEALRLCRSGLGRPASPGDLTTGVMRLAERSEVGAAVPTDPSADERVTSGRLRIEGGAPGARIQLRRRGSEPRAYAGVLDSGGRFERDHVEEGTYELAASIAGFHPYASTVEVTPRVVNVVRLAMRERDGVISVDSDPRGAEVMVDGTPAGVTPLAALAVASGSHVVAVSLAGHDRATREVVVRGGLTADLGVVLLQPLGRVDLTGFPDDIQFELDGKAVRDSLELRPQTCRLLARRDGYEPQQVDVDVVAKSVARPALEPWRRHGWSLLSDVERWDATSAADRRRVVRTIVGRLPDFELRAMETFAAAGRRHEVAVFVHRPSGLEFVLVPGGRFEMGSPPDEDGRRPDEPRHAVAVEPFLLARTQVPQSAWESAMGTNPSRFRGPGLPVESVSHEDALAFCARFGLALPTEAQWEFACRAGSSGPWCCDDADALGAHAWFVGNAGDGPRPVGSRRANAFGLFDLHGNVWEWCADGYAEYARDAEPALAAVGGQGAYRVFRGGGWSDPPHRLRAAQRAAFRSDYRFHDLGFRPALPVTPDLCAERTGPVAVQPAAASVASAPSPATATAAARPALPDIVRDLAHWDAADRAGRRAAAEAVAALAPGFALTEVAVFEAGGVRRDVALFRHAATELEFALVPGGSILPQSASRGGLQRGDASPRVRVAPFLASRTPVHQAAWRKVMGANPAFHVGDRLPVEQVNLSDALAFCERAGLSLPTEAQWEFACRAGVDAAWCCGDESRLPEHAWFERNSGRSTHPVGEKRPNALGLLDVMGNVWEWCAPDGGDPANARIRGGAWTSEPRQLQSAWSLCYPASTRMSMLGFRPVRALATSEEAGP